MRRRQQGLGGAGGVLYGWLLLALVLAVICVLVSGCHGGQTLKAEKLKAETGVVGVPVVQEASMVSGHVPISAPGLSPRAYQLVWDYPDPMPSAGTVFELWSITNGGASWFLWATTNQSPVGMPTPYGMQWFKVRAVTDGLASDWARD